MSGVHVGERLRRAVLGQQAEQAEPAAPAPRSRKTGRRYPPHAAFQGSCRSWPYCRCASSSSTRSIMARASFFRGGALHDRRTPPVFGSIGFVWDWDRRPYRCSFLKIAPRGAAASRRHAHGRDGRCAGSVSGHPFPGSAAGRRGGSAAGFAAVSPPGRPCSGTLPLYSRAAARASPFLRARRPYSAGQAGSSASGPSGTGTAGSNSHEASRRTGTPRAVSAARNGSGPSSGKVSRSVR